MATPPNENNTTTQTTNSPTTGIDRNSPAWRLGHSLGLTDVEADHFAHVIVDGQDVEGAWNYAVAQSSFRLAHPGFNEGYQNWGGSTYAQKYGDYNAHVTQWKSVAHDYGYNIKASDYILWSQNGWTGDEVGRHIQAQQPGGAYEDLLKSYGFSDVQIQQWKNHQAGIGPATDASNFGDYVIVHNDDLRVLGYTTYQSAYGQFHADPQGNLISQGAASKRQADADAARDAKNQGASDASQAAAEARAEQHRLDTIHRAADGIFNSYDPTVRAAFTEAELKDAALAQASGGEFGNTKTWKLVDLFGPVNQYYLHFYGTGVTRDQLNQYYDSGATPDYVNQTLDSLGIQRAFPSQLNGLFTPDEIKAWSDSKAGIHTPDGDRIAGVVDAALQYDPIYRQYKGRGVTRQEVEDAMKNGVTPEATRGYFGGQSWQNANQADVQYYSGAFGEGPLTSNDQRALGQQEAGYTTPLGQKLQTQFDKAVERARVSFQGTVAHIEKNNAFGQTTLPDTGA